MSATSNGSRRLHTSRATTAPPRSKPRRANVDGIGSTREANRQLNYAIHVAAIAQLRYPGPGQNYHQHKRAEGKNTKEAIRALKRQISNAVYRALVADARRLDE